MRELRQEASRWLRRVEGGETLSVTVQGRPVALLVPVHRQGLAALEAAGELTEAESDLMELPPLHRRGAKVSQRLEQLRADER